MVEIVRTLRTIYWNVRLGKALNIEKMKISPGSLSNALQDNYKDLVGLPMNTRVKISTEYDPNRNPICYLGHVVSTGINDFDPGLVEAWLYIGEGK